MGKKVPQIYIAISYMVVLMNFGPRGPKYSTDLAILGRNLSLEYYLVSPDNVCILSCVTGQRMYFVYKLEHTVLTTVPVYY